MQIQVLLFAAARDAAGNDSIEIELPDGARAADAIDEIGRCCPQISALLPSCRLAVDCCYVGAECKLTPGSEIALIPPVSGG